jgi:acyl-CoA synthetase (AMP-forming)/AMP-acid ligase II
MYTLGDIPRYGATSYPDNIAMVYEGSRLTYREFNQRINRFAHALLDLGCGKSDRLCIIADNCSKYMEAYFAAAKIGMSVTPLNVRLGDDELAYVVNDSEAKIFVVGDAYEDRIKKLKGSLINIRTWITLDNPIDGFAGYEDLLQKSSGAEPDPDAFDVQETDIAILMYTGGTTGLPKGVMISHRQCAILAMSSVLSLHFTPEDATCYVLPIFHVSFWPILGILTAGGKACINRVPNLEKILQLIQDEKCTHMNLVPTIYGWLVDYPNTDKYDLSSLRLLTYAGSPMPVEVLKKCIRKFGNKFKQVYGATEVAPISWLEERDHHLDGEKSKHLFSAGKETNFGRIKIVNDDDVTLGPGEKGEICIKGKNIMLGYWKNPELTAMVIKDGWYHTSDIGYMDEEGYLYITDRKADMIISGGENVYPAEVENVIYQHPAVFECSVVSAPNDKWGEVVQAVVVLKPGAKATEEEIIEHCKKSLAGYKCPKAVAFWDSIPKTIVGKIIKKDIKAKFWEGKDRMVS